MCYIRGSNSPVPHTWNFDKHIWQATDPLVLPFVSEQHWLQYVAIKNEGSTVGGNCNARECLC